MQGFCAHLQAKIMDTGIIRIISKQMFRLVYSQRRWSHTYIHTHACMPPPSPPPPHTHICTRKCMCICANTRVRKHTHNQKHIHTPCQQSHGCCSAHAYVRTHIHRNTSTHLPGNLTDVVQHTRTHGPTYTETHPHTFPAISRMLFSTPVTFCSRL